MRFDHILMGALAAAAAGLCAALWANQRDQAVLRDRLAVMKAASNHGSQTIVPIPSRSLPSMNHREGAESGRELGGLQLRVSRQQLAIKARGEVEDTYGPVLPALLLAPAPLKVVKNFLEERIEKSLDARAEGERNHLAEAEIQQAVDEAQGRVDAEMRASLAPDVYGKLQGVLEVSTELGAVNLTYAPQIAYAGDPLTGEQTLALAKLFQTFYSASEDRLPDVEAVQDFHTNAIDPSTGLSAPDRAVLEQAAALMSPRQLAALQSSLSSITKGYLASRKRSVAQAR
jgi:hypothetical protein